MNLSKEHEHSSLAAVFQEICKELVEEIGLEKSLQLLKVLNSFEKDTSLFFPENEKIALYYFKSKENVISESRFVFFNNFMDTYAGTLSLPSKTRIQLTFNLFKS